MFPGEKFFSGVVKKQKHQGAREGLTDAACCYGRLHSVIQLQAKSQHLLKTR